MTKFFKCTALLLYVFGARGSRRSVKVRIDAAALNKTVNCFISVEDNRQLIASQYHETDSLTLQALQAPGNRTGKIIDVVLGILVFYSLSSSNQKYLVSVCLVKFNPSAQLGVDIFCLSRHVAQRNDLLPGSPLRSNPSSRIRRQDLQDIFKLTL